MDINTTVIVFLAIGSVVGIALSVLVGWAIGRMAERDGC